MVSQLTNRLQRVAYKAQQWSIRMPLTVVQRVGELLYRGGEPPPTDAAADAVRRRYDDLLERDLAHVEEGLYPRELLFQIPVGSYARALPLFLRDVPSFFGRALRGAHDDLPAEVDLERYPAYYRRNFHWQTDGFLSRRSAEIYDLQVEILFLGTADVMRRQVIPPLTRQIEEEGRDDLALLDVGCGTGRTLAQIARTHPDLRLTGLDLSPYYLEVAREVLADEEPFVSLVQENAEEMPFRDGTYDAVSSVFVLHELPRDARHRVLKEMARVVRPGGRVIVCDSAQLSDAADITPVLEGFAEDFHEPYYRDYVRDDVRTSLEDLGLEVESVEPAFVSKVVVARRP